MAAIYSHGGNRWNILGFNFTKRDALSSLYKISMVSLNKELICHETSENKTAVCEKTADLRSGNFSYLNSACSKVLVPVKIFQFQDMGNRHFSGS